MHISELDTPSLLLDLDVMERNIARMAAYCKQSHIALRPHIKTHKIPAIAQRQIAAGAIGITAAKPSEALIMADGGMSDILIAYPIVSPAKAEILASLIARGITISVSLDSPEAAECLAAAAHRVGVTISLLVEIDVGFGRCGVASPEQAVALATTISRLPGARFGGLMYYPGHLFVKPPDQDRLIEEVDEKVEATYAALSAAGFEIPVVSGGSTPTALRSAEFSHLTEIRPGMYPLNDRNLVEGGFARVENCALTVLTTVVSTAVAGRAILDGGSKTFSSDRLLTGDGRGFGLVVNDPGVLFYTMSEEHGHLDIRESTTAYKVGQHVRVIPNHVCTTINMHNTIYAIRGDQVEDVWKVAARGCVR
jgi:D-serine deaminase-like pyridoxal phosphate-dependent protein